MAITLVTGLPGHGKTLYTISRWKDEAAKDGRPVFHNGIKGLDIPNWQVWDVEKWQDLQAGSIMVIDEAQFAFPTRGRGEPPDFIARLATHRHLGIDIVVITQDPMLIDNFVRKLVDRHFHIVRKFGTNFATIHEFANGAKENVAKSRAESIRHEWRYPKEVFDLYTSSELHTVKRRIPARVWLLLAIPFIFAALATWAYFRLRPEAQVARMEQAAGVKPTGDAGQNTRTGRSGSNFDAKQLTPLEYAQAFTPRVEGLPHTAPAYDEVTKPAQAPYPAACLTMKGVCKCYTQQGTKLDTGPELCKQIAEGGFFVAWNQQTATAYPVNQSPAAVAPPTQPAQAFVINGAPPAPTSLPPPQSTDDLTPRRSIKR